MGTLIRAVSRCPFHCLGHKREMICPFSQYRVKYSVPLPMESDDIYISIKSTILKYISFIFIMDVRRSITCLRGQVVGLGLLGLEWQKKVRLFGCYKN